MSSMTQRDYGFERDLSVVTIKGARRPSITALVKRQLGLRVETLISRNGDSGEGSN